MNEVLYKANSKYIYQVNIRICLIARFKQERAC
jgi:hypothetical protein